jgi:hypothetical protein
VSADERVTAFVGMDVEVPEGVPPTRTFRELGGDIVIGGQDLLSAYLVQEESPEAKDIAHASALPIGHGRQWPESTVAYTINANITGADRTAIINSITSWNASVDGGGTQLKVRFVPRYAGDGRPYVDFFKGGSGGCGASQVGRHDHIFSNWYSHSIHIDCFDERTIHHEMGHTAGLWHEQSRCDRDNFVTTTAGGINCDRVCGSEGVDFGPYNYLSVMHYPDGFCGFARNPPLSTFHRGQPWQAGTAPRLDINDVQGLNQSYVTRPGMPQIGAGRFLSFVPAYTTRTMAIPASSTANNVQAVLFDRNPGWLDQHFTLTNVGEGFVQIRPRHAPTKCLEVLNFQSANGTAVGQFECDGASVQHWIVAPNAGTPSTFDVINRFSGKALEVAGWGDFNGALFQQWDHHSGSNQRFSLPPAI